MKPDAGRPHVLFVCGQNWKRSPTAERLYRNDPRIEVRSAGLSPESRRQVLARDLEWADLVIVMEEKHKARLREEYRELSKLPPIRCLEIPDEYEYMDQELTALITEGTETILKQDLLIAGRVMKSQKEK